MHIQRVRISGFKGVDVELPWASALVFCGANDSGKTNILEAFVSHVGVQRSVRGEPHSEHWDSPTVEFDVELNGLDRDGHPDQELFLSWMLAENIETYRLSDRVRPAAIQPDIWSQLAEAKDRFRGLSDAGDHRRAMTLLVEQVVEIVAESVGLASMAEAMALREFTASAGLLCWRFPRDEDGEQESMFEVQLASPERRGRSLDSFLDALKVRVIRVEAHEGAGAALLDRLERVLPWLMTRYPRDPERVTSDDAAAMGDPGQRRRSPWLVRQEDLAGLRPTLQRTCADISMRVNELTPQFVSDSYAIEVTPLFFDEWDARNGRHVAVRLRAHSGGHTFDLGEASSSVARWAGLALSEAIRPTEEELDEREPWSWDSSEPLIKPAHVFDQPEPYLDPSAGQTVYVFDEPETHLHPLAQEQAAAWVAGRADAGARVLLATNSPSFLALPMHDVEYFSVVRSADWQTHVERMTSDVFGTVRESAESLGLSPTAFIQMTKAWLLVEGEHDLMVLDAFYGRELRRAWIRVLPVRGGTNAKVSIAHLDAHAPLGKPFFYLSDNARAEAFRARRISIDHMTDEERSVESLGIWAEENGINLRIFGLPYPDIIYALPMEAVRQVVRENGGKPERATSWPELLEAHVRYQEVERSRDKKPLSFKSFVLKTLGLRNLGADQLVKDALRIADGQPPSDPDLTRTVSEIIAAVGGGSAGHM